MLLLRKNSDEGVWIKHTYRGAEIELKIRPADPEVADKLHKKYSIVEFIKDPDNQQRMVKVKTLNNESYIRDMADFIIEDFRGIGYSATEPLPVNKETKMTLVMLAPLKGEQALWDFIIEKANELRTLSDETESQEERD
jgi:hypothetical protein